MAQNHRYEEQFLNLITSTQQAYEARRTADYVGSFSDDYYSVQLHTDWGEDKAGLSRRIASDAERFELLGMDFEVLRTWFVEEMGFAHMRYVTRLRFRDTGRVLVDKRENLVTAGHRGKGCWELNGKIVLKAENFFEDERPDI
ncbi:MAG TPA: hypothetical protein ENO21_01160 [Firmicutes bacterium]|nr:hypothetical protein [Bacillota bacterium]